MNLGVLRQRDVHVQDQPVEEPDVHEIGRAIDDFKIAYQVLMQEPRDGQLIVAAHDASRLVSRIALRNFDAAEGVPERRLEAILAKIDHVGALFERWSVQTIERTSGKTDARSHAAAQHDSELPGHKIRHILSRVSYGRIQPANQLALWKEGDETDG